MGKLLKRRWDNNDMVKKVAKESVDIVGERLDKLKEFFPEVFSEGKVDFEKLHDVLGNFSTPKEERYSFNWVGRQKAFRLFQEKAKGTLIFDKEESVEPEKTENVFIEGDNLEVLKLLQKGYQNKIKMIYIDPPYNTGKDFIYKDNFKDSIKNYLEQTGQVDSDGNKMSTNTETNGRFHSDWLTMMYPRLFLARNLLKKDGVVFISIDDHEVVNLRKICDEIFGEDNFIAQLVWENKEGGGSSDSKFFRVKHEYILCYAKSIDMAELQGEFKKEDSAYSYSDEFIEERGRYKLIKLNSFSIQYSKSLDYEIELPNGKKITPSENGKRGCWRWSKTKFEWGLENKFIEFKENTDGDLWVYTKQYFKVDHNGEPIIRSVPHRGVIAKYSSTQATKQMEKIFEKKMFDYSKPYDLIKFLLDISTNKDEIILDFFAGSGTTAHAVLDLNEKDKGNRKFICVQIPEETNEKSEAYKAGHKTISKISRERIRRVLKQLESKEGFKAFKLTNSNYKIWDESVDDSSKLKKQLQLFETPLVAGYKELDVIYEVLIKEGYSLNSQIEKINIKPNRIYSVTDIDSKFFITLDSKIDRKSIDELKLKKSDIFICLDSSLDDSQKKNISLKCDLRTI